MALRFIGLPGELRISTLDLVSFLGLKLGFIGHLLFSQGLGPVLSLAERYRGQDQPIANEALGVGLGGVLE